MAKEYKLSPERLKALLGKVVGDDVVVEAPAGVLHYQVLDIQKA